MTAREQRAEALRRANEVRTRRSEAKRQLKAGDCDPVPLLERPPDWLAGMKAVEFLMAIPRVGRVKASRMLERSRVSPSRTLDALTDRQRRELVRRLR